MTSFWPASEAAQLDYERLREAALAGLPLLGAAAERFWRGGLPALIQRPSPGSHFVASLEAMPRPRWSPYEDPRQDVLAQVYRLLTEEPSPLGLEVSG